MKINVINVLNEIASEEASEVRLYDSYAPWNMYGIKDYEEEYDMYKYYTEQQNELTLDLIDHCEKYGWEIPDYELEDVLSFEKWYEKEMSKVSKYYVVMVA